VESEAKRSYPFLPDEIYQRFRYMRSIDYSKPLTPPLDAAEAGWLKQQLQARHRHP
jgi:hypothetical protein